MKERIANASLATAGHETDPELGRLEATGPYEGWAPGVGTALSTGLAWVGGGMPCWWPSQLQQYFCKGQMRWAIEQRAIGHI